MTAECVLRACKVINDTRVAEEQIKQQQGA